MTIQELQDFRIFINRFLKLIENEEKSFNCSVSYRVDIASKTLEFIFPKLRDISLFYIRKFCEEPRIYNNNALTTSLRVDVVEKIRKHTELILSKTAAKRLRTTLK